MSQAMPFTVYYPWNKVVQPAAGAIPMQFLTQYPPGYYHVIGVNPLPSAPPQMMNNPSRVTVSGNTPPSNAHPVSESLFGPGPVPGLAQHAGGDVPQGYVRATMVEDGTGRVLSSGLFPQQSVPTHLAPSQNASPQNAPASNAPHPNAPHPNALPPNTQPPNAPPQKALLQNTPLPSPHDLHDAPPVSRQDLANRDNELFASLPYAGPQQTAAAPPACDGPNFRAPRLSTCNPRAGSISSRHSMNEVTPESRPQQDAHPFHAHQLQYGIPGRTASMRPHQAASRETRGRLRHRGRIDDQERAGNRAGQYQNEEVDRNVPSAEIRESENGSVRTSQLESSPTMSSVVDDEQQSDDPRFSVYGRQVPTYEDPTTQGSAQNDASALFPNQSAIQLSPVGYPPPIEAMHARRGGRAVQTAFVDSLIPAESNKESYAASAADPVGASQPLPGTDGKLQYGNKVGVSPAHTLSQNAITTRAEDESELYRALATSPLLERAELDDLPDLESQVPSPPREQLDADSKHEERLLAIKDKLAECEYLIDDVKQSMEQYNEVLLTLPNIVFAFKNLAVSLNNVAFNTRFILTARPEQQQGPTLKWLQKQQICLESIERNTDKLLDFCNVVLNPQTLRVADIISLPAKIQAFDLKMRDIDHLILVAHHALCELELRAELHSIDHNIRARRQAGLDGRTRNSWQRRTEELDRVHVASLKQRILAERECLKMLQAKRSQNLEESHSLTPAVKTQLLR